jgi:hypothetical protein
MTVLDYVKLTTGGVSGEWYADVTSNVEVYDNFESGTTGQGPNLTKWTVSYSGSGVTQPATSRISTTKTPGSVMFGGTKSLEISGAGQYGSGGVTSITPIKNRHVLCCWQMRRNDASAVGALLAPIVIAMGNATDGWITLAGPGDYYSYGPNVGTAYTQPQTVEAIALGDDKYSLYYCGICIAPNRSLPNGIQVSATAYWYGDLFIDNIMYSKSI